MCDLAVTVLRNVTREKSEPVLFVLFQIRLKEKPNLNELLLSFSFSEKKTKKNKKNFFFNDNSNFGNTISTMSSTRSDHMTKSFCCIKDVPLFT